MPDCLIVVDQYGVIFVEKRCKMLHAELVDIRSLGLRWGCYRKKEIINGQNIVNNEI